MIKFIANFYGNGVAVSKKGLMRQFARTQCLHLQRWAATDLPSNGLQCNEKTFNPLSYCKTLQQNAILYQHRGEILLLPGINQKKPLKTNAELVRGC